MHCCSRLSAAIILLGVIGCSQPSIPNQPTLVLDISSIGCWGNGACTALGDGGLYSANFIGSAPAQSVQLQNEGSADLTISSITQSGDSAFTWAVSQGGDAGTLPMTVHGLREGFLQVIFTPTQAKSYVGSLTISSNSVQTTVNGAQSCGASCLVNLSGSGVEPPPPYLAFITPIGGPAGGGTPVTLSGDHFLPGATVDFGGSACASPMVMQCTTTGCQESITCTTTAHAPGTVEVTVTNPNGATSADGGGSAVTYYYCTQLSDGGCA